VRHRIIALVASALLFAMLTAGVYAQETDATGSGSLLVEPSRLTIGIATGCYPGASCVQTHQLTLRSTETITDITPVSTDLRRADGLAVLQARTIAAVLASDELTPNRVMTMTVTVDLRAAPAGEYDGELLLMYEGGVKSLPMTVRLRHWWGLPFGLLVIMLGLGFWFGHYRDRSAPVTICSSRWATSPIRSLPTIAWFRPSIDD